MNLYNYKAKLIRSVDGDTVIVEIDHGFKIYSHQILRLARINAPELNGPNRAKALEAKAFIDTCCPMNSEILVSTNKLDNYGRYIAEVFINTNNLSDMLLEAKLVEPYLEKH